MATIKYRPTGNTGLFDKEFNSEKLIKLGNPLEKIAKVVDFEMFRAELELNMLNHDKTSNAGAKPIDVVLMFKVLVIKRLYNLSDEHAEFQILDRQSFKEFLGLSSGDKVPDARTIWTFQENLIQKGVEEKLFLQFHRYLEDLGLYVNEGKIVDASFAEVPRQRNRKAENAIIKEGRGDELWNDKPNKKRHKDIDARWTKKNGQSFYGYKDHAKIDNKSKLIDTYCVTSASVHDSQATETLISETDAGQDFYADSAYTGEPIDTMLKTKGMNPKIIEKGYKNAPLTEQQKLDNKEKSKTRCRVEHVFGFVTQSMGDFYMRNIGFARAKGIIGLTNLLYNICRYEQIVRLNLLPIKK
jgi:IS5 family transposase